MNRNPISPKVKHYKNGDKENSEFLPSMDTPMRIPPPPAGLSSTNATPIRVKAENDPKTPNKTPNRYYLHEKQDLESEGNGSVVVLGHVRASKGQQEILGCDTLLSPVRHSARIRRTRQVVDSASKSIRESLLEVDYAYAPNESVRETYFNDEGTPRRLF